MRIENAIQETQGPQQTERRQLAETRRKAGRTGDVVEISQTGRSLGTQLKADLSAAIDVRQARVEEVRQRVASGFYDQPEVREAIADAVLSAGVVDAVAQEVQSARTAKRELDGMPDVREDRVALAQKRLATGFYDSAGVRETVADGLLSQWVG